MLVTRFLQVGVALVFLWAGPSARAAPGARPAALTASAVSARTVGVTVAQVAAVVCGLVCVARAGKLLRAERNAGEAVTVVRSGVLVALGAALVIGAVYLPSRLDRVWKNTDPQRNLERLQGEWVLQSTEIDGRRLPRNNQTVTLIIRGNELRYGGDERVHVTMTLFPEHDPARIDFADAKDAHFITQGIYRLDGDELEICSTRSGPRPTRFETEPYDGHSRQVFVRKPN